MAGRLSMTNSAKRSLVMPQKSILKSKGSPLRGGTPGRSYRRKRAVSFHANLERIHFFDPNKAFKPSGRGGGSVDFKISITCNKKTSLGGSLRIRNGPDMFENKKTNFRHFEQELLSKMTTLKKQPIIGPEPQSKPGSSLI